MHSPMWLWNKSKITSYSLQSRRRQWQPTLVLLPGESHGWRSLVGCSLWGRYESDTTERLHFHFLSCVGEGNGNPFQCSSLENPRDQGAWWAALYGVAQSQTQLKRLSSSFSLQSHFFAMESHCFWIRKRTLKRRGHILLSMCYFLCEQSWMVWRF